MNRTLLNANGELAVKLSSVSTDSVVLFYPGVPGEKSQRNEDIAEKAAQTLGKDAYVLHYKGLGLNTGAFSFFSTLSSAAWLAEHVSAQGYKTFQIVGHSWGGLLALEMLKHLPIEKVKTVILLSPVTEIPSGPTLKSAVDKFLESSTLFRAATPDAVIADLENVSKEVTPHESLSLAKHPTEVIVFQAKHDHEVPVAVTKKFVSNAPRQITFEVVDTDHSFLTDRAIWVDRILEKLGTGTNHLN